MMTRSVIAPYVEEPMLGRHAKAAAREWVMGEAVALPGFAGAFITGSTDWLPDDAPFPPSTDVDAAIVLNTPTVPDGS